MSITRVIPVSLSTEISESTSADLVISSVTYPDSANGASNTGGDTVTLTGSNFDANIAIYVNSNLVSNINVSNSSYLTFSSPTLDIDKYIIYAVNPDGTTGVFAEGLNVIEVIAGGFQGTVSGYTSGGIRSGFNRNTIDKFPFASNANATDVGDLTRTFRRAGGGNSSNESGYTTGGGIYSTAALTNIIDKFPFASDANATDVGDLTQTKGDLAAQSSSASGYVSGGNAAPPILNVIEKFPFSSDSNATDVSDLTQARNLPSGQSSSVNGYTSGGQSSPTSFVNIIDKFPFASDTNASDVGDLSQERAAGAGQSSEENGYTSGGALPTEINTIDKFPFASDANATDVGDLTQSRAVAAGQSSTENGYTSGGGIGPGQFNTIDKFPFASNGNATDVGDLTQGGYGFAGQQD